MRDLNLIKEIIMRKKGNKGLGADFGKKLASLLGENEALRRGFMRAKGTNFKKTQAFFDSVFLTAKESIEKAQAARSTAKRLYEDKGFRESYLKSLKEGIRSYIESMKDSVKNMTFEGFVANLVRLAIDVWTFACNKYYSQRSSEDAKRHGESEEEYFDEAFLPWPDSKKEETTVTQEGPKPDARSEVTEQRAIPDEQGILALANGTRPDVQGILDALKAKEEERVDKGLVELEDQEQEDQKQKDQEVEMVPKSMGTASNGDFKKVIHELARRAEKLKRPLSKIREEEHEEELAPSAAKAELPVEPVARERESTTKIDKKLLFQKGFLNRLIEKEAQQRRAEERIQSGAVSETKAAFSSMRAERAPNAGEEEITKQSRQRLSTKAGDDVYAAMKADREKKQSRKKKKKKKKSTANPSSPTNTSGG